MKKHVYHIFVLLVHQTHSVLRINLVCMLLTRNTRFSLNDLFGNTEGFILCEAET